MTISHRSRGALLAVLGGAVLLAGCKKDEVKDAVDEARESRVTGRVLDDRGAPVAGATVRLLDLAANPQFVEGADAGALEAYIDREAVLAATSAVAQAQTGADGTFTMKDVAASAFLAVATAPACSAGFAGFDEETGVLDLNTLLVPTFDDELRFAVPDFVIACASAPEVGPDGNSGEALPDEPPPAIVVCEEDRCSAAGGTCVGDTCALTCSAAACTASGGTCVEGECVIPPTCVELDCIDLGGVCEEDVCVVFECGAECEEAGGTCIEDGSICDLPPCLAAAADCGPPAASARRTAPPVSSPPAPRTRTAARPSPAPTAPIPATSSWLRATRRIRASACRPPSPRGGRRSR
jgi:hypothetical protein